MPFRPLGLAVLVLACALPVAAVCWLRRSPGVTVMADLPATPPLPGGLRPLLLRQELHPGQLSERYACRFPIGNGSAAPIAILGASTTCGCAAIRFEPRVLPPGTWGTVAVELAARGRFGIVEAAIDLRTDAAGDPVQLIARLHLPPQPRLAGDELRIPAGQDQAELAIAGGDARFQLVCLDGPSCSNPSFDTVIAGTGTARRLVAKLVGARPAAGRIRLRLGYDNQHAVDATVRVIAE